MSESRKGNARRKSLPRDRRERKKEKREEELEINAHKNTLRQNRERKSKE